tara:strand:- start:402 stop:1304 length:903 start_codon:yes stop_codon:yes gene_type:complete
MSYLKTLNSTDVIVTPFTVHKEFSYSGTPPGYSTSSVFVVDGKNESYPLNGGYIGTGSEALVYNSIKQLYYSNYLSGSNGQISEAATASFNPDGTITGPFYTTNYLNNIQSIDELRSFPIGNNDEISVLSIPSTQFGEYIKPGSVNFIKPNGSIYLNDDGQGNLLLSSTQAKRGNVIYKEGIIIWTGIGGAGGTNKLVNPQWESSLTIFETQYKCTIRANEFNYSLNPSLLSNSLRGRDRILLSGSSQYSDFVTGSDFSPFVTTVGLYDEEQNLLAVGKLSQPLPTSQTTDTTILINLDR